MAASLYEPPSASPGLTDTSNSASNSSTRVGTSGGRGAMSPALSAMSSGPPSSANSHSTIHSNINVKYELNAGALSVDATGSFGVLAGRKGLHLVDLESPYTPAATLHHQTKWEVTVVKCNPHVLFKGHVASTSNHNTLIWNVANGGGVYGSTISSHRPPNNSSQPLIATLRAHTRPVSDVSWSPTEPWILATCSADTKTHLWDIRTPQKPVQTLCAFTSSAIQVEWNRVDQTSIATAHDGEVRIWDTRASDKAPAVMITAHMQKIYGIDWHPTRMYELVTCSEDKTVKFWNVTQPRVCQGMLTTGAPVWRARYTPFGDGLVTSSHRLDNNLRLWALSYASEPSGIVVDPVHTYTGHSDLVKGFVWRARPNSGVYQLVSWSKNQELRMWRVDPQHLEACGYDTTSYTEVSHAEPRESLRTDASHAQLSSKYDLSALKTDFVPLVVPPSAVPLGASEYSLDGHVESMNALLVFAEDLVKIGEDAGTSSDDEDKDASATATKTSEAATTSSKDATRDKSMSISGTASALPCPRFSGACFSGPNMLLVFDSRVAIGQTRSSAVPAAAVAAGKPVKTPPPVNKLPRTYEELLDLRDSRFATKKNKKPPVKLMSSANVLGAMDMSGSDWGQHDATAMDMVGGLFNDDGESSVHGYRSNTAMYYSATMLEPGPSSMMMGDREQSVHGGSEYLKTYFTNSEYHLPINHPEHRISVPTSGGVQLSPRRNGTSERAKRIEQASAGPSLNLDLSLSVTVLDLSKLCGVSSILTYKTEIVPQKLPSQPQSKSDEPVNVHNSSGQLLESGSRSLVAWMLQAAEKKDKMTSSSKVSSSRVHPLVKKAYTKDVDTSKKAKNHLSHVLQSLLQPPAMQSLASDESQSPLDDGAVRTHSVSNTCAHNAKIASLAGRSDLKKVWSLLEISTAPSVELPMYKTASHHHAPSTSLSIASAHPWSAHPFGKRLVNKILNMYEQTGDLPAAASIVCALKPPEHEGANEPIAAANLDQIGQQTARSGGGEVGTNTFSSSLEDDFYVVSGTQESIGGLGMRSRRSSNALSSLTEQYSDASDTPPLMRNARRSISHNEIAGRSSFGNDRLSLEHQPPLSGGLRIAKDWAASSTANRMLSPSDDDDAKGDVGGVWMA
uniref:Uncharacterized protein n=1 Tax=Globisporangium ultimum (strain ATCC 200006 / CBS 805.95 / DAOM BR144) TaxID=431595 RepID=K3WSV5_GLOUD